MNILDKYFMQNTKSSHIWLPGLDGIKLVGTGSCEGREGRARLGGESRIGLDSESNGCIWYYRVVREQSIIVI